MADKPTPTMGAQDQPDAVYDARTLGTPRMIVFGAQHMFAMFGATILVPTLTGLSVSATLLFAGIGTLIFHFFAKGKVPAFLGSSFAFIAGYSAIAPNGEAELLPYACLGVACAAMLYPVMSVLFKAFGAGRVIRFFPPVVTGPIVISIGLILASSAINNCSTNWIVAIIAVATIVVCNIWARGIIRITPILMGVVVSYTVAAFMGLIDFTPVADAAWIGLPVLYENTVFSLFTNGIDTGLATTAIITIMPLAIATIVEHVGDVSAIATTCNRNFIVEPRIAALFAILLSFCPKFAAVIEVMPACVIGGVSLVLYGMISAVGIRNLVENHVDFTKSRNVLITALIIVLSIGIAYTEAGAIVIMAGSVAVALSGLAVGSLVGILMNIILPGRDEFTAIDGTVAESDQRHAAHLHNPQLNAKVVKDE